MKTATKPNALLRAAMLGFFSFFLVVGSATKYYVRTDGNNNNNGLSNTPTGAWKSVNDALYGYCNWGAGPNGQGVPMLPGDTLFVNDGVFVEDGYGYGLKIDGINGTNTNRFVLKSINKWGAKLQLSSQYNSFNIYNSKGITIDGFDIYNVEGSTNIYSGVVVNYPSEFVTIRNCKLHNFGLSAIGGDGSNIIVENNEVYDNSIRNPGNGSGINFYHPKVVSTNRLAGGYGHIIRCNRVYNNYCTQFYWNVMGQWSAPTDGNGIIIDDWNFTQNPNGTAYKVPCLIENNVCFKNGGSGIRVYDSDNVTVRNNTCYYNCWVTATYPSGSNDYPSGDIGVSCEAGKGNNIVVVNNICLSDPSLPASNFGIGIGDKVTNGVATHNFIDKLFFTAGGSSNVIGSNAQFVLAGVNPLTADFRLTNSSPVINIGSNSNAAAKDYIDVVRPQGGTVDAGAYEFVGCTPPSPGTISAAGSLCVGATTAATSSVTGGAWSINPITTATINATSGLITGVGAGTATITYTVTVDTCVASTNKTILINALPSAGTISAASSLCVGATTTATSSATGGVWSISPTSIATINSTSGVITGVTAGSATITYTVTTNGCTSTAAKTIVINALPSAGTISAASSLCVGATTTATSSATGGAWSISSTSIATVNSTSGVITGVSAGTASMAYTVTTNGCTSTATKTIDINALPSAGTISAASSLCVGATTTATSSATGGVWSISPTSIAIINSTSGVITGISAGTATMTYTVTTNGCSSTATKTIDINALPSAGTISAAGSLCVGTTTTATSSATGGAWSISATSIATINSISGLITGVAAGTATISYTVTTNGCVGTATKSIDINALPSAGTISAASSLCVGVVTTATSSATGGVWSISPTTIATINSTSGVITGVTAGTATIAYTVTTNGCVTTSTKTIDINAIPNAGTVSAASSLCVGATTTASSSATGGVWSISPTTIATINSTSGVITGVAAGTATIAYSVTTNGCVAAATKTIAINALPSAGTISAATNLCVGLSTTATSTVSGGVWSVSPASIATINATSGVIVGVAPGTANISYSVTANGCSSSTNKTMTVNGAVASPTFSLPSGMLTAPQNITLATATSGATIRYTLNNSTPTMSNGTIYSAPIAVSTTQTIKAVAYTATCISSVSSATYTFITPILVRARSANSAGASMRVDVMSSSLATGTTILQSQTFNNLGTAFANYTFNATVNVQPQFVRVNFINDGGSPNYDLEVDYMKTKNITYQTEAATTYGIGIWKGTGCNVGIYDQSSFLQCNGYFHYLATNAVAPVVTEASTAPSSSLSVYPNPAKEVLYVELSSTEEAEVELRILDLSGRQVWQQNQVFTKGKTVVEIPLKVDNGVYFMTVIKEQRVQTVKFIVQQN